QRRKEISIHRVIGADSRGLQGMVLLELAVFASVAWLAGYLLAMFAVPIVLSAVGFMQFKSGNYNIDPALSFGATLFTALSTLGLALLFGRKRAREFINLEIEEGVKSIVAKAEPKYWLHWSCFILGSISVIDTWMEMNGSESGIIENFFLEGLFGIFGPFLLWIGGALVLGRLGAKGPQIMQVVFGKTKLLSDVKRGLKGSGSTESVNRLAVIMLLTLSIVTLAAVQGYTGSLVDERTVDVRVGSDLQVTFEEPHNESIAIGILQEIYRSDADFKATTIPSLVLKGPDGDYIQTYVVLDNSDEVLNWNQQAIPGKSVAPALDRYANGGFSAGEDSAFTLDLAGSWSNSKSLDDILISESDERSVVVVMGYETLTLNFTSVENTNSSEEIDIDWEEALFAYSMLMSTNLSGVDFSGQDLSDRDLSRMDFTNANLSGADLSGANLSESLFFRTDLSSAKLTGANLTNAVVVEWFGGSVDNADFSSAILSGMYGTVDSSNVILDNTTCASGNISIDSACDEFTTFTPTPLAVPILMTESPVQIERNSVNSSIKYMGLHEFIPGVNSSIIADSLVIGESSWRSFVGDDVVSNYSTNNWIIRIDGVSGGALKALGSQLEADSRIGEVIDWKTEHESVERNGGLIFGTPGLLSLQFVVASIAAIASSFVFLSLVLNQRKKELAVLQAIGASPTQILRLVLFEILSIIVVSMLLGLVLGIGLAFSFNGFFDVFGFIFQLFGGASTNISRELVYPWFELALVSISVFTGVVIALLLTTRRALNSDLAMVLKGE
ncbi:MAG: FtsX-like permease family protein, partial [Candidatus Thermoplasmatota archaeon]|nr:FtsX-like permease family protein [Candidatus Thermoplasmatota archaeon]